MKLLVGFYDYPFGYGAREYDGEKLFPVELEDFDFHVLIECDTSSYKKDYIDFEWLKESCKNKEGQYEKYLEVIERLFSKYEQIIVCNDGCYNILNINLEDNNNESVGN